MRGNGEELLQSRCDLDGRMMVAQPSLAKLTAEAVAAKGPGFPPAILPKLGGVDPLGLRQINFDLMDQVFPGLNNVARHIRPFVMVTWAWRRANQLAKAQKAAKVLVDVLVDFVDRIDVIYVWSQLLRDPNADLPGSQVLEELLEAKEWTFGGADWRKRREVRRYSTALTAPINYGPALKMLGWVNTHPQYSQILIPTPAVTAALDAFEAKIDDRLAHPAFSKFGSVTVTSKEVRTWSAAWALESVTKAEAAAMSEMLFGAAAPQCRQVGGELMFAAASHEGTTVVDQVRSVMSGPPSDFMPAARLSDIWKAWRRVQIRQLFRLSLEALFYWTIINLDDRPRGTDALVDLFISQVPIKRRAANAREWLKTALRTAAGPTELMAGIEEALNSLGAADLAPKIVAGFALCLAEPAYEDEQFERWERLPLFRARREAIARENGSVRDFIRHVFESWVLAQHVFWSVGRGLADARAQGRTLLRLKIMLDEGGWTLAPGAAGSNIPLPTRDRLETMLSLSRECGLLKSLRN
jgi:hypothetical protein